MNLPVAFDAPGKLMLVGEYAVLYGAKAIASASSVRLGVRIESIEGQSDELLALGLFDEPRMFSRGLDGGLRWERARPREFELFEEILGPFVPALNERHGPGLRFIIDSRPFMSGSRKLGLGSSAAMAVALNAALRSISEHNDSAELAHRKSQAGLGSGTDVAIARLGGTQCVVREGHKVCTTPSDWPHGLEFCVIDTGHSQSTTAMLQALHRFESANASATVLINDLVLKANEAAAAWHSGAESFIESLSGFRSALLALDAASGLGIYSHGHAALDELALQLKLIYKPSGAGGGDVGIAFGTDVRKLDEFRERAAGLGGKHVDLQLSCAGLTAL